MYRYKYGAPGEICRLPSMAATRARQLAPSKMTPGHFVEHPDRRQLSSSPDRSIKKGITI
jgi:hypothetical protein